jgi:rRNA processing protein Krr1/Pno1
LLEEKLSETEKTVIFLKAQVEVAKNTEEELKNQLEEKDTQLSTNLQNVVIQIEEDKKIE